LKVAVIGANGGMGSFFVRYFRARGASVRGSDRREIRTQAGLARFKSNAEAVHGSDVTILAVPMEATLKVAREVASELKPGSTLIEISSVKGRALSALKRLVGDKVELVSIHPLFGPALESTKSMKIAVVGKGGEARTAKRLFPDARIIQMTREDHDRTMAVVLSLTHMLNLVYAGTVSRFLSPEEFMRVSTPNSSVQLTLAEAVLAQDAKLSFAIQRENPYTAEVAKEASRELKLLMQMVKGSEGEAFEKHLSRLSEHYRTKKRARKVIKEIYSAAEKA
jgi:prephenate dehydrogenase